MVRQETDASVVDNCFDKSAASISKTYLRGVERFFELMLQTGTELESEHLRVAATPLYYTKIRKRRRKLWLKIKVLTFIQGKLVHCELPIKIASRVPSLIESEKR